MDNATMNERLRELIREIAGLPKGQQKKLLPLVNETRQRHQDLMDNSAMVDKSLDNLRILTKYILFDLEATRRERDQLKKLLDEHDSDNTDESC